MLKRLELIGFKSFADRTWFTFPPGLTAIVGPNGSGKSNVVDAVKWILGEQSAKSLRGGEMADVIFNGSTSRKGLGLAEVTLTLDNTDKQLNTDAAEVSVTRRVYRDGTGEYLINGQISRLRDIRDMFLGSGAGSTHYCIIEQGRVDAVLQASNRDRRAIFEEAAGISRFKAKKVEALRKLEHTEDNLSRLRDIHGEVEGRLRRVRLDAEKAKKFQEYSVRLRELRVGIGLREYHGLMEKLTVETRSLDALRGGMSTANERVTAWESETKVVQTALSRAETEIAQATEELSDVRRRIATFQERQGNEWAKSEEIAGEVLAAQRRAIELIDALRGIETAANGAKREVAETEGETEVRRGRVAELDASMAETETELAALRKLIQDGRDKQFHLVGRAAAMNSEAASAKTQLDKFTRDRDRKRREQESKKAELASVGRVLDLLGHQDSELQTRLTLARQTLEDRRREREEYRVRGEELSNLLENLRVRHSGLSGRIEVLEGLERSQEGLGTGVREVLAELAAGDSPLCGIVIGLVADSLRVPRDIAPLIDIALGDIASHFVVCDSIAFGSVLSRRDNQLAGRVSFLPLAIPGRTEIDDSVATADRFVTCDKAELATLPRQLLGKTVIVDDLTTARRLAAGSDRGGFQFVTQSGERLEANGTLTVGLHRAEAGILSRKSELRELRAQAATIETEIANAERQMADLRDQVDAMSGPIRGLEEEIRVLTSNVADLQTEILKNSQQRERLTDDLALIRQEWEMLEEEMRRLETFWRESRTNAQDAERQSEELKDQIAGAEHGIRGHEHERSIRQQEQTSARVALAETVQRLTGLRDSYQKLETDLSRGRAEAARMGRHQSTLQARQMECDLSGLRASAGLSEAFRLKELFERQLVDWSTKREHDRERRRELTDSLVNARTVARQSLEQFHNRELAARDLENARTAIADRLRDDFLLDLAAEYAASPLAKGESLPGEWNAAAAGKEVEDLKKKTRHLGNVSLESLTELHEVESRATELQAQIADVTQAENSLRAVIAKINEDSRRLFNETYEAVRLHFQELFRKLFAGGMADVILENPEDVLESGIDIVARPPGKELRSISLMSGGEKTLTAIALLLAIFRSKPSPFCLLDEVDAALDEANTERLAKTIRDFTNQSQFIVITHKKRTMAYADVLYGITMQESGISKQVAVRFDDWPDEGATAKAA